MTHTFTQWLPLNSFAVSQLSKHGEFPAVYALREISSGELLKFGHTGHLRRRIMANYLGGMGGDTTQRIHADLFVNSWIDRVEIAWLETKDKADAERQEKELRQAYKRTYGKLPSWDRQW